MELKLALRTSYQGGGRAAECAFLLLSMLRWDDDVGSAVGSWPEIKTSKLKCVVFAAGRDALSCFFTDFGDALCVSEPEVYDEDDPPRLIQILKDSARPAAVLGAAMKNVGANLAEVPDGVSAASIRPGVVNFCCLSVPPEFVCQTTGHSGRGFNNLYEYLDRSTYVRPIELPLSV